VLLVSNAPVFHVVPYCTFVLSAEPFHASKARIRFFNCQVSMTHQHLSQKVNTVTSVPVSTVIVEIRECYVVSFPDSVQQYLMSMSNAVLNEMMSDMNDHIYDEGTDTGQCN
jgi:hypothetical protein